jgi:hypothetical protein
VLVPVLPATALYGRLAGSVEAAGAAKEGGGWANFWSSGNRRALAAGTATAMALIAGWVGLSAIESEEPGATADVPAASAPPAPAADGGGGPPPDAPVEPVSRSPSVDAYDTDGVIVQGLIQQGGGGPDGSAGEAGAASGANGVAGSGSELPFTGIEVLALLAAGLLLVAGGLVLRLFVRFEEA